MMHGKWLEKYYEYPRWWQELEERHVRDGFITEPIGGRRRDCLDGTDAGELASFVAQAGVASIMNAATIELRRGPLPCEKWGPGTGIIFQGHDSLVVECPEKEAERVKSILVEALTLTHASMPGVTFTADAKIGKSWDEV